MTLDEIHAQVIACRRCPRLAEFREKIAREKRRAYRGEEYWGKPVPGFGDAQARVFVVGLAPGAHGSNRTGRQFTGDGSGDFLYPALYRAGFASQPVARARDDGMRLTDLYTAPVCRCAPPDNKPTLEEMRNCQPYLEAEIAILHPTVFVALGSIAYSRIFKLYPDETPPPFAHGALHRMKSGIYVLASYHPSRQNTQTRRLTPAMFDAIWEQARQLLEG